MGSRFSTPNLPDKGAWEAIHGCHDPKVSQGLLPVMQGLTTKLEVTLVLKHDHDDGDDDDDDDDVDDDEEKKKKMMMMMRMMRMMRLRMRMRMPDNAYEQRVNLRKLLIAGKTLDAVSSVTLAFASQVVSYDSPVLFGWL